MIKSTEIQPVAPKNDYMFDNSHMLSHETFLCNGRECASHHSNLQ